MSNTSCKVLKESDFIKDGCPICPSCGMDINVDHEFVVRVGSYLWFCDKECAINFDRIEPINVK